MTRISLSILLFLLSLRALSQTMAISVGEAEPSPSSVLLDVQSTTQGMLPPRMTVAQRDAIADPVAGLMVYNSTTNCINVHNGSNWIELCELEAPSPEVNIQLLSTIERDAIVNPEAGLTILNTTTHCTNVYDGTQWLEFCAPIEPSNDVELPVMTQAERDDIANPAVGLTILNSTTQCTNVFNGSEWLEFCAPITGLSDDEVPLMTTIQRDAIINPPGGLTIFNTTTQCTNVYTGIYWAEFCAPPVPSAEVYVQLMTTSERDAMINPSAGLTILNTSTGCTNIFNGSIWLEFCAPIPPSPNVNIQLLTTVQRDALINPPAGLTIFNTTTQCTNTFNGSIWVDLCSGNSPTSDDEVPLMTTVQRDAIVSPSAGLTILNITTGCANIFDGNNWLEFCNNEVQTSDDEVPLMTTLQRDALVSPSAGLTILNITTGCINVFDSNNWLEFCNNEVLTSDDEVPLLTTAQRDGLINPAPGLTIFNTTTQCTNVFNGNIWVDLCAGGSPTSDDEIPLMTAAQRDALPNPPAGLTILNTTTGCTNVYDGTSWLAFCAPEEPSPEMSIQLMTSAERDALINPATGLTILNTSTGCTNVYDGTSWLEFCQPGPPAPDDEVPLMTTAQRDALVNPPVGLTIFNTTTQCTNVYNGNSWVAMCPPVEPSPEVYIQLMTTAERDQISNPPAGLTIYNTTTHCTNVYNGTLWAEFCAVQEPSAELEMPILTQSERDALINPNQGYTILNSTTQCTNVYYGSQWLEFCEQEASGPGVFIQLMTTSQRNALADPEAGLMIFNTTTNCANVYDGNVWLENTGTGSTGGDPIVPLMTTAERNAIVNPQAGMIILNTTTSCTNVYNGVGWVEFCGACPGPATPTSASHTVSNTQIIWDWNPVSGALGYKWGTTPHYILANDVGSSTTFTQTGLATSTAHTLYVWAYDLCGGSATPLQLTATTTGCVVGAIGPGGGRVFYCGNAYPGYIGLEAASTDQSASSAWGCTAVGITGAEAAALGSGLQNTNDILAGCTTSGIPAKLCSDLTLGGFDDWFLPSFDELKLMYSNLHQQGLGGFAAGTYWSSSEASGLSAGAQNFNTGALLIANKGGLYRVRAVRRF